MNQILLTYVLPVYNTERYVLHALQSIVEQPLEPAQYEVLVVDDGSTDSSASLVETFSQENPQVRLFRQENAGVSAARNLAIDNARGRYLLFVDSDDYLNGDVVPALLHRAIDDNLDVLSFNYCCKDTQGGDLPHTRDDNYATTGVVTGPEFLSSHSMTPYVWRFLLRRDYIISNQLLFDTSLIVCEDGSLIAKFLLNASRVAHDDCVTYCYVKRDDSAMHNADAEHLRRRIFSQVDSAVSIDATAREYEKATGLKAPASVDGLRNVYLYFSMTKALVCGMVGEVVERICLAGLYPFPCVGPESDYHGMKWKVIHIPMMFPGLWNVLSKVYRMIKKR